MQPTILVIDDFASVRLYHMTFLGRKGYRCLGAANGTEALEILRQSPVDLVLLDMVMPEMNGAAFEAELARDSRLAQLPVLVITSEEAVARAAFSTRPRPFGLLVKPVMPTALLQQVERLLAPRPTAPVEP